jgi:MerR family transcriptional regulator, light-induced transcriptional regulator
MPGLRDAAETAGQRASGGVRYRTRERSQSGVGKGGLIHAIESEVIPQLVRAHVREVETVDTPAVERDVVANLTELAFQSDTTGFDALVTKLYLECSDFADVLVNFLAPAARRAGALWDADECTFTDVTVAVSRLQRAMHDVVCLDGVEASLPNNGPTALMVAAPGEQHTFGAKMAAELFRRNGWTVADDAPRSEDDLARIVSHQSVAVVGLSLSNEVLVERLTAAIRAIRRASLNRDVCIIVGGKVFADHPDWVAQVGADLGTSDVNDGAIQALQLCGLAPRRT